MKTYPNGPKRRSALNDLAYNNTEDFHADTVYNYFIGALSNLVNDETWNDALDTVKRCIEEVNKS